MVQVVADELGRRPRRRPPHPGRHRPPRRTGPAPAAAAAPSSPAAPPRRPRASMRDRVLAIAAHAARGRPGRPRAMADSVDLGDGRPGRRAVAGRGRPRPPTCNPAALPPGTPSRARGLRAVPGTDAQRSPTPPTPAPWRSTRTPAWCTILRYVVSEDCGNMINPMVVEGQIAGGVVQGIGGVFYEHIGLRRRRQPAHHHVPRLPAADRRRGARPRVRPRRDAQRGTPAATRAWARAAPSRPRRRWPTRCATPSRRSASRITTQPLTPDRIIDLIEDGRPVR